uniref:Stress-enhanced protein 6 n=1 Tax=Glaucocystis nostochinearum TaxID=38271 RepID=D9PTQ9_9EUKA|nr:TPA_inf: stress-enhanced protein 6 [Glaucocystis nostochinearum]|eukprot:EC124225.1.p1 GENE.EC124225.1~~EC124225.1.p1  ORF type:complete len:188 (+),score=31.80 EC124225.1:73-636(+)
MAAFVFTAAPSLSAASLASSTVFAKDQCPQKQLTRSAQSSSTWTVETTAPVIRKPQSSSVQFSMSRESFSAGSRQLTRNIISVAPEVSTICVALEDDGLTPVEKLKSTNPSGEGYFGILSRFAETFNGRAAMLGFVIGIFTEYVTGEGIFEQLGITSSRDQVLFLLLLVAVSVATSVGTFFIIDKKK